MDSNKSTNYQTSKTSRGRTTVCYGLALAAVLIFVYRTLFYSEPVPESKTPIIVKNVGARCRSVLIESSLFPYLKAVVVLSGDSDVTGTVRFSQAHALGPVTISGEVKGLKQSAKHGFHVQ